MPTSEWSIEAPTSLEFDDVTGLRVRLIAGSVAVLATNGTPSLEVSSIEGDPLNVTYEDGVLTVAHENLSWEGLLKWLRPQRHAATVTVSVPRKCPAQVGVVSATAVMSGISARASVKSVSGGITLDGVTGDVDANTVSGAVEAQGINGKLNFNTVSGDLTLADGLARAPRRERGQRRRDRGPRPGPARRDAGHHGVRRGGAQAPGRSRRPGEPALRLRRRPERICRA